MLIVKNMVAIGNILILNALGTPEAINKQNEVRGRNSKYLVLM